MVHSLPPTSHPHLGGKDAGPPSQGTRGCPRAASRPGGKPELKPSGFLLQLLKHRACICPQTHTPRKGERKAFDPGPFFHEKAGPEKKVPKADDDFIQWLEVVGKSDATTTTASNPPSTSPMPISFLLFLAMLFKIAVFLHGPPLAHLLLNSLQGQVHPPHPRELSCSNHFHATFNRHVTSQSSAVWTSQHYKTNWQLPPS